MGCAASKTSKVVVPMPTEVKDNQKSPPDLIIGISAKEEKSSKGKLGRDSLNGSQNSLNSTSDTGRSDRESSAQSTRTADSGMGELEDDETDFVTERSPKDQQIRASVDERPPTPELCIEGTTVSRRKSLKEKRVSFSDKQEKVRNRINALSPLGGVTERPQSRGGMAFDIMVCPETGNVKKRPQHLRKLEKRKKKVIRRTKEEIEEKLQNAENRRKQREQHLREKAQAMMSRDKQQKDALDEFAQRQTENTEVIVSS